MFSPHCTCPPLARFSYINAFTVSFANCECINVRINYTGAHQQFHHVNLSVSNRKKNKERITNYVFTGVSSADEPKCEISCRVGDGPKDEETVDPDSIIPSHCSIKTGRNIGRNMTWKEVNDKLTHKPGLQCLVLKSGNSVKRIFFASKCCVPCYQLWSYNGQNSIPNEHLWILK